MTANTTFGNVATAQVVLAQDLAAQIPSGMGIGPEEFDHSTALFLTILHDDSGSMKSKNLDDPNQTVSNAQLARDGHNVIIKALKDSKQCKDVIVGSMTINGHLVHPYVTIDDAPLLTETLYDANTNRGTPYYDSVVVTLKRIKEKVADYKKAGIPCRTITILITDGDDQHSKQFRIPEAVRPFIEERLSAEMDVVAAVGIADGRTDFRDIFERMGIPADCIHTPASSESEFRKTFLVLSQSTVTVSQAGAAGFSKAAAAGMGGGFGN
jgi:hypothetical protein